MILFSKYCHRQIGKNFVDLDQNTAFMPKICHNITFKEKRHFSKNIGQNRRN
jgi:hypothetical protein